MIEQSQSAGQIPRKPLFRRGEAKTLSRAFFQSVCFLRRGGPSIHVWFLLTPSRPVVAGRQR